MPADRGGQGLGPTYNSRLEGGLDFLLLQQHPVNLLEEGVLFDGVFPVLCRHTAQALVRILGHELWEEGTGELLTEAPRHGLGGNIFQVASHICTDKLGTSHCVLPVNMM